MIVSGELLLVFPDLIHIVVGGAPLRLVAILRFAPLLALFVLALRDDGLERFRPGLSADIFDKDGEDLIMNVNVREVLA